MLLELQQLSSEPDVILQVVLRIHAIGLLVAGVLLNVQPDRGSRATGSRQADDDAGAVGELDVEALVGRYAAVEIGIGEVACFFNCAI